ncbi:hypothetical protein BDQ12DRAFT_679823 [Crucibulum laeve]|uniref:Uncharacterized protein n=1 Tax=Crucibulum laeve TaxID=68775 RepID=A0A5C3M897_9AGAR|nr:hypothetical protein BDQ12DRAFT_679823 [Crucibulum laeve]
MADSSERSTSDMETAEGKLSEIQRMLKESGDRCSIKGYQSLERQVECERRQSRTHEQLENVQNKLEEISSIREELAIQAEENQQTSEKNYEDLLKLIQTNHQILTSDTIELYQRVSDIRKVEQEELIKTIKTIRRPPK